MTPDHDVATLPIRLEVIEARRCRRNGAIVLARPVPMKVAGGFAIGVTCALVAIVTLCDYTSKVRVQGRLVPAGGSIKVVATQYGRVTALRVKEGARVRAGQVLFELTGDRYASNGPVDARIGATLGTRREQLLQKRDVSLAQLTTLGTSLANQQRMAEREVAEHRGAIRIQDEMVKTARENVARYRTLAQKDFVSKAQLAQYGNALNAELARRSALALNLSSAQRSLAQVEQELASLAGQRKLVSGEARQALAAVEQEEAELDGRRALRVTAPAAGIATGFSYDVGQAVQPGAVMATVLPADSQLEGELMLPSRAKAAVAKGQPVYLRVDGFPYQQHGMVEGTVKQIEQSPINDGAPGTVPLYRVRVTLSASTVWSYGKQKPLEPGMLLEADILNDRRRLIAWVFNPLLSAARGRTP